MTNRFLRVSLEKYKKELSKDKIESAIADHIWRMMNLYYPPLLRFELRELASEEVEASSIRLIGMYRNQVGMFFFLFTGIIAYINIESSLLFWELNCMCNLFFEWGWYTTYRCAGKCCMHEKPNFKHKNINIIFAPHPLPYKYQQQPFF